MRFFYLLFNGNTSILIVLDIFTGMRVIFLFDLL
jgi:hypothetical protein